ncbi:hypothetical protein G6M86_20865 [Agrobacterium tumefaciens]|uniref:Uncharacterized protein n=1 Tax=Agrobacterium tumefaciens TaxID=358 RepID=A0AAJ4N6V5_AGRTU|nr:hypothetical protein G6M86_20865 [Agrobacterium tumefaciens]
MPYAIIDDTLYLDENDSPTIYQMTTDYILFDFDMMRSIEVSKVPTKYLNELIANGEKLGPDTDWDGDDLKSLTETHLYETCCELKEDVYARFKKDDLGNVIGYSFYTNKPINVTDYLPVLMEDGVKSDLFTHFDFP